jgi:hypothetical protein
MTAFFGPTNILRPNFPWQLPFDRKMEAVGPEDSLMLEMLRMALVSSSSTVLDPDKGRVHLLNRRSIDD